MYSFASDEYITGLVKTHSKSMFRAAYAIVKNRDDAEDAVQEAFIKLMKKQPAFNDDEHAKAWLMRVTINLSKDMLKASSRKNEPVTDDFSYRESKPDSVLFHVMKLEENYRTVIHLYYYEGYSIKEIASILKLPLATVGTRLRRGKAKLKNMLEGDVTI